jgi:hypothetical protein
MLPSRRAAACLGALSTGLVTVLAGPAVAGAPTALTRPGAHLSLSGKALVLGQRMAASAAGSRVPAGIRTLSVDFGDGTSPASARSLRAHLPHTYSRAGTFRVTLRLTDRSARRFTAAAVVLVRPALPSPAAPAPAPAPAPQPAPAPAGSRVTNLPAGGRLGPGEGISSPDGTYNAVMQSDGNFVEYGPDGPVFSTATTGTGTAVFLDSTGNLSVLAADGSTPAWSTNTGGSGPGGVLTLGQDGTLTLTVNGLVVWSGPSPVPSVATPPWWSGTCDVDNYPGAQPLGTVWHGLIACGPRPRGEGGRPVHFFPGAWGEYEFQCVELSMRWLYQAYGVRPYNANGDQVVANYDAATVGGGLVKVTNATPGSRPLPGDVISFTSVHTGVVMGSSIDDAGNGTVTVIDENAAANGTDGYLVRAWSVSGASGWLHRP